MASAAYEYIRDKGRAAQVAQLLRSEKAVGFDQETTGLDPHKDRVILAQFTAQSGQTYLIDTRDSTIMEPFRPLLEDEKVAKIGVNLTFDYQFAKGTFGIDVEGNWDLMFAEQLIMAGIEKRGFSFAKMAKKYLGLDLDKTLQKSFINHVGDFTKEQLDYAAADTIHVMPLAQALKAVVNKEGLSKPWGIECRALPAFGDMTFYGQKINIDAWKQLMVDNQKVFDNQDKELRSLFAPIVGEDLFGYVDMNLKSTDQMLYCLQQMGVEVDGKTIQDTSKDTFKKIQHYPIIIEIMKYRSAKKLLENYGQTFLDAISPETGRIHPEVWQIGTGTGRVAAKSGVRGKTNTLNIPRLKAFRHAFGTDIDRMVSTVDFSGAELRIMADKSGDPLMVKGFNMGVDFHCYVAAMLFNREKVEKSDPIRTPTKTLNFGLAYGMGPARLFAQLNGEGHKITMEECKDLFDRYKKTFKTTINWLNEQKQIGRNDLRMINQTGRHRRWLAPNREKIEAQLFSAAKTRLKGKNPTDQQCYAITRESHEAVKGAYAAIEREAANFMVQSENVEWTKDSMYWIRKRCKERNYDARFYNSVYDETVLDVATKDSEAVHDLQKKTMIECGNKYLKQVPCEVEGHLKPYWTK